MSQSRQVLEEFELRGVLRTSAQSTLFEATAPGSSALVVIKVINPVSETIPDVVQQRFVGAAERLRRGQVDGLPRVIDAGLTPEGTAFLVTDRLHGIDLASVDEASATRRLGWLLEVLGVVERLGAAGVIHGNLSPDNVLLLGDPPGDRVRLLGLGTMDFLLGVRPEVWPGAARSREFLAPELAGGAVHATSDRFSFAVMAAAVLGLERRAAGEPRVVAPRGAEAVLQDLPVLCAVLSAALHPDPARRTVAFDELRDALVRAFPDDASLPIPGLVSTESPGVWDKTVRLEIPRDLLSVPSAAAAAPPSVSTTQAGIADEAAAPAPSDGTLQMELPEEAFTWPAIGDGAPPVDGTVRMELPSEPEPQVVDGTVRMELPPAPPTPPADATMRLEAPTPEPAPTAPPPPPVVAPPPAPQPPVAPPPVAAPPSAPQPPLPEPAAVGSDPEPPPPTVVEAPLPSAPRRSRPRWLPVAALVGGAAVLVVVVVLGLRAILGSGAPEATPVPATPTPRPRPTVAVLEAPRIDPQLELAQARLMEGDTDGARSAFEGIPPEVVAGFSETELEIYQEVQSAFSGEDREKAVKDLRGGLEIGSIRMMQRGVGGLSRLSRAELAEVPGLADDLEKARRLLKVQGNLRAAETSGDRLAILETAAVLVRELPRYSGAPEAREKVALEIEAEAEQRIAARDFEGAIRLLGTLSERWPERPGVADRIAWCRQKVAALEAFERTLQAAIQRGIDGDPEGALTALEGASSPLPGDGRLDQVRGQLEEQLARLDAKPPVIAVDGNVDLGFRKNQALTLPLRITDDYRVVSAVVLLRREGERDYRELPLEPTGTGTWSFTLTPELHGNENVELYIVASDRSGHESRLGAGGGPMKIERKRWYEK